MESTTLLKLKMTRRIRSEESKYSNKVKGITCKHIKQQLRLDDRWNKQQSTYLGLVGFDQDFADLEVLHLIIPTTGQHVVAHTGQGVPHQEISITHNQSLWHLDREKNGLKWF